MTSSIQIFNNDKFSIRTINENGNIWFVAKDVMTALEYSDTSTPAQIMQSVPEMWKGIKQIDSSSVNGVVQTRDVLCLTEQGLYFFLGRSDKPKAIPYQIWIAGDVVPSIRATGSYSNHNNSNIPFTSSDIRIDWAIKILQLADITGNQLILALDKVYKKFIGESLLLTTGIELEAPVKEQALTASELAELIGVGVGRKGARIVNKMLEFKGFQRRVGKYWEPTETGKPFAVVIDMNKQHSDGTPVRQVKWNSGIRNSL